MVTGGASGFGLEIARRLVAQGARVAIVDVSEPASRAAAELGASAIAVRADVTVPDDVRAAVDRAVSEFGGWTRW